MHFALARVLSKYRQSLTLLCPDSLTKSILRLCNIAHSVAFSSLHAHFVRVSIWFLEN